MKCNKNLSLRRAISVQKLLRNNFGIKNKMKVLGIGYRKPIASNKTSQGRQKNRRVSVSIQPNKLK
jgi:outer membrane protein OmpA-like peptidoglycan-associated protein